MIRGGETNLQKQAKEGEKAHKGREAGQGRPKRRSSESYLSSTQGTRPSRARHSLTRPPLFPACRPIFVFSAQTLKSVLPIEAGPIYGVR